MSALESTELVRRQVALGSLTTYKLGGPARYYSEPASVDELAQVLAARRIDDVPMLVLGRGSNVVISDEGFDGLVLRLGSGFGTIDVGEGRIRAGAAVSLPMLARAAVAAGCLGLEFFVGIPGSVGGAVRQNAGCHGSETADVLLTVETVDSQGRVARMDATQLGFQYRHSELPDDEIVIGAEFNCTCGLVADGETAMRDVIRWRKEHQPGGTLNAGSVFKNPPGDSAGRIIDSLGLKGVAVGGASVSTRHANFFVADSDATASDVRALVLMVQQVVEKATGLLLEPEIRFAGFEEAT